MRISFFKSEFSVPSMTNNNFLIDKRYKMIHGPVKKLSALSVSCVCAGVLEADVLS